MKQEDRDLLLRDLCARLPYGVKCQAHNGTLICVNANNGIAVVQTDRGVRQVLIENLKPYLRPISSMTEEEKSVLWWTTYCNDPNITEQSQRHIGWFLKNHFDYRGLIPKGLAFEAPKDMYDIK